jgi:hypothetical protein
MSVLIIALPRTGSTSLLYRIAKEKNYKPIFEPFDGSYRNIYNKEKNVVVKTIICHHYDNLELSKQFDDVILLTRKNILECAQSHAYQTYFSKKKNYNSNNPYVYEEVPFEIFELCYNNIVKWNKDIIDLSIKLNTPITYYEDIFDKNSEERLRKVILNGEKRNII